MSEIRALKDIQAELKQLNIQYARTKDQSEKLNEKFTPSVLASMTDVGAKNQITSTQQELAKSVQALSDKMALRETEKEMAKSVGNIAPVGDSTIGIRIKDGFYDALTKFLGVDYRAESFKRLADIKTGISKVGQGFKDLGKALGLGKAKDLATGIFDFLKNALILGFSVVGLVKFLEGWRTAEKWFGENPDFGNRLSSALAKVLKSFGLIEDEEATAKKINEKVNDIKSFIDKEVEGLKKSSKGIFAGIGTGFEGVKNIVGGAQDGDPGTLLGGLKQLGDGIFQTTKELILSDSILANIAGIVIAFKVFKTMVAAGAAVKTIGAGILASFTALGGAAGISLLAGVFAAGLGIWGAMEGFDENLKARKEEYEKSEKTLLDKFAFGFKLVDQMVVDAANKIVETITFGAITGKDLDRWNKITNDALGKVIDAAGNYILEAIEGFFDLFDANKREQNLNARKIEAAAKLRASIDQDSSGTINSYSELSKAIMTNKDMSYGERARANRAMLDQKDQGVGYNQFINSTSNPTYNNIVSAFSTSAGASSSATLPPPSL
jgi:hypothetical protein